jgi:hypothetical protein
MLAFFLKMTFPDTSSPIDIDGPGLLLIGVSPIDRLSLIIRAETRVAG